MKRLTSPIAFAALAGVVALLAFGAQQEDGQAQRYAKLVNAVNTAYSDIDQLRSRPTEERIIDLPEDGGAWWTSIVYPTAGSAKDDPTARRVEAMFATNPRLQSLLAQTKVNRYHPGHPLYETKYKRSYGVPDGQTAIIIQQPDGKVAYKVTGQNIPFEAEALANAIEAAIADCCPRPKPEPTPEPTPDLTPAIPDTIGPDAAVPESENLAGVLAAMGLAALVGAGIAWKKEGSL